VARVERETGIKLDVITAQEEARLAVLGCHTLLEPGVGPALVFDIGGGSTELVLIDSTTPVPLILDWHSAPWGVVSLTELVAHYPDNQQGRAAAYAEMRRSVSEAFAPFVTRLASELADTDAVVRLLGTSGTVTTLASVHLGLARYDRRAVDGLIVPAQAMREIAADLAARDIASRGNVACIGEERADLVVAGCAILECILDIWPANRLVVADRGIREGILRGLLDHRLRRPS
jgi:exopolyphosphatase / guanosine-5'-triphosphate,3'-diphosphate pyrophosphatase